MQNKTYSVNGRQIEVWCVYGVYQAALEGQRGTWIVSSKDGHDHIAGRFSSDDNHDLDFIGPSEFVDPALEAIRLFMKDGGDQER